MNSEEIFNFIVSKNNNNPLKKNNYEVEFVEEENRTALSFGRYVVVENGSDSETRKRRVYDNMLSEIFNSFNDSAS